MQFSFRGILATVLVGMAFMSASGANAALLKADLVAGSGDGKLTRDTATNLEWLDVRLTLNQTFDQVRTGPFYAQGFRHATKAELQTLFINAGIPDDGFDTSITNPNEAIALIGLLGATSASSFGSTTMGFSGSDYFGNTVTLVNYPIGTQFSALLGNIHYMDQRSSGGSLLGEAHFTGGHPFSDQAAPSYGSFLVRSSLDQCRTAGKSINPKCHGQARGQY